MSRTNPFRRGSYSRIGSAPRRDGSSEWHATSTGSNSEPLGEIELSDQPSANAGLSLDAPAKAKYASVDSTEVASRKSTISDFRSLADEELPAYSTYSSSYVPLTADPLENAHQSTRPGGGWWHEQMLVDRCLRVMAGMIFWLAVIMIVVCIALAPQFNKRIGWHSSTTSVAIFSGSETSMKNLSEGIKFLINIAATIILSASNTYQQLLTSLKIEDIKYILTNFGDSRVGTNSPFAIKHKKFGRQKAWISWIFLVATSMPVHLLANSVVGVAFYPQNMNYTTTLLPTEAYNVSNYDYHYSQYSDYYNPDANSWVDFRLGAHYRKLRSYDKFGYQDEDSYPYVGSCGDLNRTALKINPNPFNSSADRCSFIVTRRVHYDEEACGEYFGTLSDFGLARKEYLDSSCYNYINETLHSSRPIAHNCTGLSIKDKCTGSNFGFTSQIEQVCGEFKLVVRLLAAVILAVCISAKAIYMVVTNIRSRSKVKSHCLTFGDVIVAAVLEDIRIPSECLVNGGDFHRRTVSHTCHKHCSKKVEPSATGDEIGHCQKCKKFNIINNMPNLPWPTLATKSKKSLIANFGQTAVTQMITLSFASTGMLVGSIMVGLSFFNNYHLAFCAGWISFAKASTRPLQLASFDGGLKSGLGLELAAFATSNGAQLIYSMLYLLLLYNISLICMEKEWGDFEKGRGRLRCTIVKSESFEQSYLLQMPAKIMLPIFVYSTTMHWLLGLAIYADETVIVSALRQDSMYKVVTVPSALWGSCALMMGMTVGCWWAFTYSREGYIPQMFGSIRAVCSAVSELTDFPVGGIMWGDLTGKPPADMKGAWRHAGLSAGPVDTVIPNELYAGRCGDSGFSIEGKRNALAEKKRV
ncbi:hypothetical protein HDK64DRAFT_341102 [Phyllosticta capitalensis]